MKTHLKISLFVLTATALIAASAKAQTAATVSKRNSVIDSLKITDPDERKILALYDDAVTDYLTEWRAWASDPKKATPAEKAAIEKKYKDRAKEIQPSVDAVRKKFAGNYAEAMRFAQFAQYESQRLMVVYSKYPGMKGYGAAAGH